MSRLSTVTLIWQACKYKLHKLHLRYILCVISVTMRELELLKIVSNIDKKEMILITPKHTLKTQTVLYLFFIEQNSCCHPLSTLVRNLGVTLDQTVSFQQHPGYVRLVISDSSDQFYPSLYHS